MLTTFKLFVILMIHILLTGCKTNEGSVSTPISKTEESSTELMPNIVFILTDDQGMGDIGAFGNPVVSTPHIDELHSQSIRLKNFHVDPTCSPTRSALLTGKYSLRAGVWHTVMARHMLAPQHVTLAEVLKSNGYITGLFGKWHLGDNYPYRPQDQGFDKVVMNGGGGVGQAPDFWGNTQFGDTYFEDGKAKEFAGYATQVWFEEATKFIRQQREKQISGTDTRPFFSYITTNAPHTPWRAPFKDLEPYLEKGLSIHAARFYAMASNIDSEVGKLRETLKELGIDKNTIFVYMTDNGSALRERNFFKDTPFRNQQSLRQSNNDYKDWHLNAGMRGYKGEVYDGGHRVPFIIHWPNGGLDEGKDLNTLTAHFDVLPTLVDLIGLQDPAAKSRDGTSLVPIFNGKALPDRNLVVTNQRVDQPSIERPAVVMNSKWRYLPHSKELFDITQDPLQKNNVITSHPDVVKTLDKQYKDWWEASTLSIPERPRPVIGSASEPESRLTSHDFIHGIDTGEVAWFPGFGSDSYGKYDPDFIGREETFLPLPFELMAHSTGKYKISLYLHDKQASKVIPKQHAMMTVNGEKYAQPISHNSIRSIFEVDLKKGPVSLTAWFADTPNTTREKGLAAFYVYIEKI